MKIENFDKIYVLHLSNRKDRYDEMRKEFTRMNLWDNITIWWTCKRPFARQAAESIPTLKIEGYDDLVKSNPDIYGSVFNCALEHYTMIKTSYERGFNNIMIFEDDIAFCNDRQYFDACLSKIPTDYQICKLYHSFSEHLTPCEDFSAEMFSHIEGVIGIQSTAAYCLNREGMKKVIDAYDKQLTASDVIFLYINPRYIYKNNYKILYIQNNISDIY